MRATTPRAAGASWRILAALTIGGIAAVATASTLLFLDHFGPFIVLPFSLGSFAAIGLVVALRRPDHPIGWLFLLAGACYELTIAASAWSWRALVAAPGSLPGGDVAAWFTSSLWIPAVAATLFAVILFPSGRPPTPGWRRILAAALPLVVIAAAVEAFGGTRIPVPLPMSGGPAFGSMSIANPFTAPGWLGDTLRALAPVRDGLPVPLFLLTLVAVVVRFRRSTGVERQQLKLFALAASLSVATLLVSLVVRQGTAADIAWAAGMISWGLVPLATGIAILRHRLFDIDVVIRRTLTYALVVGFLGLVYVGLVLALQTALSGLTASSGVPVALSTLAIAALFGPVRRRVRDAVDRRFFRSHYDAQRTSEAFGAALRDELDLPAVGRILVGHVSEAVQPTLAVVWVRDRGTP